jgi:hypothetical protein
MTRNISDLSSLHGCQLRAPFSTVLARFGPADDVDYSPVFANSQRFGNYVWRRESPPISVLTLCLDGGVEYVWGVGLLGEGPFDIALGFGVGSNRSLVRARCPNAVDGEAGSMLLTLNDGTLSISLSGDEVIELQLLAPLDFETS